MRNDIASKYHLAYKMAYLIRNKIEIAAIKKHVRMMRSFSFRDVNVTTKNILYQVQLVSVQPRQCKEQLHGLITINKYF